MDKLYILTVLCHMSIASPANKLPDHLIVTWNSFDCKVDRAFIVSHRCITVDKDRTLLTGEFQYIRDLQQYNISLAVYIRRGKSKEFRKALDLSGDGCNLNSQNLVNKVASIAYKSIIKNSNYPKKCPVPKGFYFYRNINLGENIPIFFPTLTFRAELNFFTIDAKFMNISLSGSLIRK